MDLGLKNKTVLVTGASGGIGQAIARQFHSEGANVIVHYHQNSKAALKLVEEFGQTSMAVQANLSCESQVSEAFGQAINKFGCVDILIANAGVWPEDFVPLHEMSVQQWQSTLDTNLNSVFFCCKWFIKNIIASSCDAPSIVMIGSTAGLFGEAGHGDYAVTKSALIHGMTLTLKNEIARVSPLGRVNTVSPGWVSTPMAESFTADPSAVNRAMSTVAMRKVASPQDISNAVLFLASSNVAGHITGQALTVSGGMEGRQLYDSDEIQGA